MLKRLLLSLVLLLAPQSCFAEFTLVASVTDGADFNGGTSDAIDTTGANLLVVGIVRYKDGGALTFSDSKSNTWTPLTEKTQNDFGVRIYYCANPTVGTGHTFTTAGTTIVSQINVLAYSGAAASPYDQESGLGAVAGTSIQPGSITPSEDNCLLVSFCSPYDESANISINSGFTEIGEMHSNWGFCGAYKIQTTAGAENPTWSWTNSRERIAVMASFKAAASASAVPIIIHNDRIHR